MSVAVKPPTSAEPSAMRIPYAYLQSQYPAEVAKPILDDIARLVSTGDFTLGAPVREFEGRAEAASKIPHAVGMASGTDALVLALMALGVGPGDEVITATNSFVASAGAIAMAGASPVLVDVLDDYTIDPEAVERAITLHTKAVIPVHLTGNMAMVPQIVEITQRASLRLGHRIAVVEDAAQAMGATLNGQHAGWFGDVACVSLHPLKMLNVWGDGGICLTRSADLDRKLRLLRNHGLETRDDAVCWGANGRISSLQAVVANHAIQRLPWTLARRRTAAAALTHLLSDLHGRVTPPVTRYGIKPSWATYIMRAQRRDALKAYLIARGVDAKIHYPKPIHLQTVGRQMGYGPGDCPEAERQADEILTLPLHEYLTDDDIQYMSTTIHAFYAA